ncbi:MAG: Uma2 family endonuclease [Chloroflexota bacterium]
MLYPGRLPGAAETAAVPAARTRERVREYWIVDWRTRSIQVHRRQAAELRLVATLGDGDSLTCPLLPGFACDVASIWPPLS